MGLELELLTPKWFLPFLEPARYKAAHGGRGSSKSHQFAELCIEEAICISDYRMVCIREVQKSLKHSVKALLEAKIRKFKASNHFTIRDTHIETRRGGLIIFQGMQNHTADSIKSLEGFDRAWVEEAQTLSQTSWDLLRPTIRKPGSSVWASWNPKLPTDPVDVFFRKYDFENNPSPGKVILREVNYQDNPFFPEELQLEMEYDRRRDPDKYKHVWLGGYETRSEAAVFRNWRVGTYEEFEGRRFLSLPLAQGADWGYSNDPNVGIRLRIDGERKIIYVTHEVYGIGVKIDDTVAFFKQIPDFENYITLADCSRPETIAHVNDHGLPLMQPAKKGPGSVIEGIEFIKNYDVVIHPDCKHTINEFTYYCYQIDKTTNLITSKLPDKKNHLIDAARYAVEDLRTPRAGVW
jgi:phage terminase large subunit